MARVRAALCRLVKPEPIVLGARAIDHACHRVLVDSEMVDLTATGHELLRVLAINAGRVVT